jgi:polyisoprenoid-binding protein YceI
MRVDESRAVLTLAPSRTIFIEADMTTLHTDADVEAFVREDLLDVSAHPRATLLATLIPKEGTAIGEHRARGTIVVHGIEAAVEIDATLFPERGGWRFRTDFYLKRSDFHIERGDLADRIIDGDVMVHIDVLAMPERVTVEPID